ncbi:hypothetical protein [Heyndrickxia coagulans]|uniref:hypothetical protein n=1 Tax=Heyndrickxia coagulans TaxID=1398 RepID=UPI00047D85C7|nr:hypothetical protein [Heyndrickxia coagulans]
MEIKNIEWISKEALEAEVIVTDGETEIRCFAQPLNYAEGCVLKNPIYCFNVSDIIKAKRPKYTIERLDEYFSYRFTGKLVNKAKVIVGKFLLELDNKIPGDINEGDFISFLCQRLDIF